MSKGLTFSWISSAQLPSQLPAELLSAPLVWVRCGGVFPPLQPLYDGPYALLRRGPPPPSKSESGHGMRSSPSAASRPARQWTPSLAARITGVDCPGPPTTTKRVAFADPLVSPPSPPARRFRNRFPTWRGGFCMPGTGGAITGATDVVPVPLGTRPINGHRHRGWTSDLFSFQPRPELGGSPVDTCLHPWSTVRLVGCTPVTLFNTYI
jgi:hypothetical protein